MKIVICYGIWPSVDDERNRLATEIATTGTTWLASIYLFLFRIVPLLLVQNAGSKMTMAPVQYLVARLMPKRPIEFSPCAVSITRPRSNI